MKVITAPEQLPDKGDLFLAGGISNCPDWQKDLLDGLESTDWTVFNPRRGVYFADTVATEQIKWEYDALRLVHTVSFWFPKETLCPITLFELGVFSQRLDTKVVVGTHPEYVRRLDVVEQLRWARPEIDVVDSLEALQEQLLGLT